MTGMRLVAKAPAWMRRRAVHLHVDGAQTACGRDWRKVFIWHLRDRVTCRVCLRRSA